MVLLIVGLILLLGAHLVPTAQGLRDQLVGRFGENGYKGLFSAVSLVGFALIVYGYSVAGFVPVWDPPHWLRHVAFVFMLPVFPLLIEAYLPGQVREKFHHPMVLAVKIWAFAHLLVRGDVASMLLFGTFLVWAIYDRISLKGREAGGTISVSSGPVRNDWIALALGLAIYALFVAWGHAALIGVPLIG